MIELTGVQESFVNHLLENGRSQCFGLDDLSCDSAGSRLEMPYSRITLRALVRKGVVDSLGDGRYALSRDALANLRELK